MIPLFKVFVPDAVDAPLLETLHSGHIAQGPKVEEFERRFEKWLHFGPALSLNSGTSALTLALRLANVEGGEVITTPMTCMATNTPILDNRAIPVWADIDPDTGLIDPNDVERLITRRTRAIIGVDWGGSPCDFPAMRWGIPLIEDAAHGNTEPPEADFRTYSFQAIKQMTTVDGGMLMCNSRADYERGKLLRWYGIDRDGDRTDFRCEVDVQDWGYKFHMNDVAATIGIVQLDWIDWVIALHRLNAAHYLKHLPPFIKPASTDPRSTYWLFTVLLPDKANRDAFMAHMNRRDIQVSKVHARMDGHTVWRKYTTRELPGVTAFYDRQCSIPVHWGLSLEDRDYIVKAMHEFSPVGVAA